MPLPRALCYLLLALLALIHWQLWKADGSAAYVHSLQEQLAAQQAANAPLARENAHLQAELAQLQAGEPEILEEKARSEQGMIQSGEMFVRFIRGVMP